MYFVKFIPKHFIFYATVNDRSFTANEQSSQDLKSDLFNLKPVHAFSTREEIFSFFGEGVKKTMLNCLRLSDNWGVGKPRVRVIRPGNRVGSLESSKWRGDLAKPGRREMASFLASSPPGSVCNWTWGNPIPSCFEDLQDSKGQRLVLSAKILGRLGQGPQG